MSIPRLCSPRIKSTISFPATLRGGISLASVQSLRLSQIRHISQRQRCQELTHSSPFQPRRVGDSIQRARFFTTMPPKHSTPSSGATAPGVVKAKKSRPSPGAIKPSASIILISPTNQVLLLRRVETSRSFAEAHTFPGGNLSSFHEHSYHDGKYLDVRTEALRDDNVAYRLAAVRETFEESGILLARGMDGSLLELPDEVREAGRKKIHGNQVRFTDWLGSVGGVADTAGLIPFTRWITPANVPRRFSTQFYIYMLPLSSSPTSSDTGGAPGAPKKEAIIPTPTHDGGLEHTELSFDDAATWLTRAQAGEVTLYPPQFFLLHIVSQFTKARTSQTPTTLEQYQAERDALLKFLRTTPTIGQPGAEPQANHHPTADIPWAEKIISPTVLFTRRSDNRVVLGLDKPGKIGANDSTEEKGTLKGGDWDRVVLVNFRGMPRDLEVRRRRDVLSEEREFEQKEGEGKREAKL